MTEDIHEKELRQREGSVDFCDWIERQARSFERKRLHRESIFYWSKLLRALTQSHDAVKADVTKLAAIHYRLGLNHQALKDNSKSIYHLKYSIRLNASEPRYYDAFGKAFLRGGHLNVARSQFEKAVRLDPENVGYLRQYSWVLMMMGKLREARLYARRANDLSSDDPRVQWNLARIYFESGMFFHSLSVLKKMKKFGEWTARIDHLNSVCGFQIDQTLEGRVIRSLRLGMRFDGRPFHLRHYRLAEQLWIEYSLLESPQRSKRIKPRVWAAALSLISLNMIPVEGTDSMDEILLLFSTDSSEVWPVVKKIGRYMECRGLKNAI